MILLDGKLAREHYVSLLKKRITGLSIAPCLAIIQIGNRSDSDSFIKSKKAFAEKIGVKEIHIKLDEKVSQSEVIEIINKYNKDSLVQGIIVQLPLPAHLDRDYIINAIDSKKDIDGLTSKTKFLAATARGIKELLEFYKIELENKKVTMIGQSKLVGIPIAVMCENEGAMVTRCNSKTTHLEEKTRNADILIVAIGKPYFIDGKYVNKNQVIIDVGITRKGDMLTGDVDFEAVKDTVSMITPVPGGVGVMTVLALFENLIDACYNQKYE